MTNQTEQGATLEGVRSAVLRLQSAAQRLRATADRGRAQLGDGYPEILQSLDTVKAALQCLGADAIPTSEGYTSDGWTDVAQGLPEPQMPVLLDIGRKYPIRAMWVAAKTLPNGDGEDDGFGEYDEADDEWYCPEGWYEWNDHEDRHWSVSALVRRWLPLPTTTGSKP